MAKWTLISLYLLYLVPVVSAQQKDTSVATTINRKRLAIVAAGNVVFYAGSHVALNKAWYAGYERTRFHFFDDNPEWNQVDKAGHVWSTYHVSRLSARMWKWTGLNRSQSALAGGISGLVYQSIIELQDAYSVAWGFSWGDVGANVAGAALFVLQDAGWKDQRLTIKMGYHPYSYPPDLKVRRNQLFGTSTAERILKDYNSQTYWISGNLRSLLGSEHIPAWLNLAVGYSADGMYGGRTNTWTDGEGTIRDYRHIQRARRIYLSPDIDLSRINTKSRLLRSTLAVVNAFRIPLPSVELTGKPRFVIR